MTMGRMIVVLSLILLVLVLLIMILNADSLVLRDAVVAE